MSLIQSILMGILQGLTEFLPVSSSGHLAIFKYLFHVNTDTGLLFDVLLHLGTLAAVCIVYWKDIWKLIYSFIQMIIALVMNLKIFITSRRSGTRPVYQKIITNAYKKFVLMIIVTTIPTGIIGLLLKNVIESASNSLLVPGVCLVITAIILLLSDARIDGHKKIKASGYKDAALVGVAQGIATLPGISRSGTTITACLLLGFDRAFAVRYSFIASLPAILGANILELREFSSAAVTGGLVGIYLVGMAVAGVVGYICIKAMIYFVKSNKFKYFAYYCAAAGIVCIIYYFVKG